MKHAFYDFTLDVLKQLITIESYSGNEKNTADLLQKILQTRNIQTERHLNNVWCRNQDFTGDKPTLLLNSHHDTVKANGHYTRDPFAADIAEGKLYGLGSNDAGAALCCLLSTFLHFDSRKNLPFNIIFAATAEEENSGFNGISSILPRLGKINLGIVGEPTEMHLAIAEKGLLVVDCISNGVPGHAARDEGDNAIYKALKDIEWFRNYKFANSSPLLGDVRMTVTQIEAGIQHNIVPEKCKFTVDIRSTDTYSNAEILETIKNHVSCDIVTRSVRLNPSSLPENHPAVLSGKKIGRKTYGSPTTSDQALMDFPTLKMGPGHSSRSHSADEYIFLVEINEGLHIYQQFIEELTNHDL